MAEFLQYTVNGLIAGSTYGLLALAMTLIYGILAIPIFPWAPSTPLGRLFPFTSSNGWDRSTIFWVWFRLFSWPGLWGFLTKGSFLSRLKKPLTRRLYRRLGLYSILEGLECLVWVGLEEYHSPITTSSSV